MARKFSLGSNRLSALKSIKRLQRSKIPSHFLTVAQKGGEKAGELVSLAKSEAHEASLSAKLALPHRPVEGGVRLAILSLGDPVFRALCPQGLEGDKAATVTLTNCEVTVQRPLSAKSLAAKATGKDKDAKPQSVCVLKVSPDGKVTLTALPIIEADIKRGTHPADISLEIKGIGLGGTTVAEVTVVAITIDGTCHQVAKGLPKKLAL